MFKKLLAFVVMLYAVVAMAAVDVNKATEAQLDGIKGIGPVTSKMIMAERKKGDFKSWEDFIERVKGVGDARAAKLSAEGLTLNGAPFKGTVAKKDEKKDTKASAREEKKDAKASARDDQKDLKASAKDDKKEVNAVAKEEKKDAKDAKKDDKLIAAKPAASAPKK